MIEIRSKTHINRRGAKAVRWTDLFLPVMYSYYMGDISKVPFYFAKKRGITCINDLTKAPDEILAGVRRDTRKRINAAIKAGCEFVVFDDIPEFVEYYNRFCSERGLDDYVSMARVSKYKSILLTKALYQGQTIAMHATLLEPDLKMASMLFSSTLRECADGDKKMIGCGNRYLHYQEFLYLKRAGYERYKWGAVTVDPKDPRSSIGEFKLSFGGDVVDTWLLRSPIFSFMMFIRGILNSCRKIGLRA